jgi:hypothetical protein
VGQIADYESLVGGLMARPSSAQIIASVGWPTCGGPSSRHDPDVILASQPVTVACTRAMGIGRTAADGPTYPAGGLWPAGSISLSA